MSIQTITQFFMWCTIINVIIFLVSVFVIMVASDLAFRVHSKMFKISREAFNVALYSFLGLYKIGLIMLNIVPYVALLVIQSR